MFSYPIVVGLLGIIALVVLFLFCCCCLCPSSCCLRSMCKQVKRFIFWIIIIYITYISKMCSFDNCCKKSHQRTLSIYNRELQSFSVATEKNDVVRRKIGNFMSCHCCHDHIFIFCWDGHWKCTVCECKAVI